MRQRLKTCFMSCCIMICSLHGQTGHMGQVFLSAFTWPDDSALYYANRQEARWRTAKRCCCCHSGLTNANGESHPSTRLLSHGYES